MSTAAGTIVEHAFREDNIIPIGVSPTADETTEALARLSALSDSLFGNELGGPYREWHIPQSWPTAQLNRHPFTPLTDVATTAVWGYPPPNSRLVVTITASKTVYFPAAPPDGARMMLSNVGSTTDTLTLNGNGRLIEGATTLAGTPASLSGRQWFYRADLSDWILLESITDVADEMPLPAEFDDFFVTGLAMRLAARFGVTLSQQVQARNADMLGRMVSRYKPGTRRLSSAELRTLIRVTP